MSDFNPDWDELEACRGSLREHMAMLRQARDEIDRLRGLVSWCSGRLMDAGDVKSAETAIQLRDKGE